MSGELQPPSTSLHASFLAALREFHAEDRNLELEIRALSQPGEFGRYVEALHAAALEATPRPAGWVPATTLWYVERDEFVGTLQIRHHLTPALRSVGGHIGYEVRPHARRRGHATRMLALALPIAHELGIDPALVTCDRTNDASRRVIEANGGTPDEPIGIKLRYWVSTS